MQNQINKRGISEIVSYVLLITLAIVMAAGVYAWLKFYVPHETFECPNENVKIDIINYSCFKRLDGGPEPRPTPGNITFLLKNKGKFDIDLFMIMISNETNNYENRIYYNLTIYNDCLGGGSGIDPNQIGYYMCNITTEEPLREIYGFYTSVKEIKVLRITPILINPKNETQMALCKYVDFQIENCI